MKASAWAAAAASLAVTLLVAAPAFAADPDALWRIVSEQCVPDQQAHHDPAPCLSVDLAGGYAVLKDLNGPTQVLVIPTTQVIGIESVALLEPDSPNYFADAWNARAEVEQLAHRAIPREDFALAINSTYARTQEQLHIHVDCIRPEVRDALSTVLERIGRKWAPLDVALAGHRYRAMRIDGDNLGDHDPFKLLAEGDPMARADMAVETLVVVGADFPDGAPGFVLLSDRADISAHDPAAGEALLDHACKVLKPMGG
ncbi:MAG TPA: CDP-diacylglycerol diphosphatase [Caulobacteraceae bacterium]|nr:CDP-diacylglycerol diphosphatase [Caulobacteraceae bacterium]